MTLEADSSTSFLAQHPRSLQYREQVETALRAVIPILKIGTFLPSIIDPRGILRVQYLGVRFDPEEFRLDLLSLMNE